MYKELTLSGCNYLKSSALVGLDLALLVYSMKKLDYALICLFIYISPVSMAMERELINLVVQSSYEKSSKMWGVYQLKREKFFAYRISQSKISKNFIYNRQSSLGSVTFKNGEIIFLETVKLEQGHTGMLVKSFPIKGRVTTDSEFSVSSKGKKSDLVELFKPRLNLIFNNHDLLQDILSITEENIEATSYKCKKKRNKINCNLKLKVFL